MKLDKIGARLTADRQSGQELSPFARAAISAVARAFGVSRAVVQVTLQRFESSTTFTSKPRTRRPEVLIRREKRYIIQLAKRKPRLSTQMLTNTLDPRISRSTIYRKRILLTKVVAKARYEFACLWLKNIEVLIRKGGRTDLLVMERDYKPPQKGGYSSWSYQQALEEGLISQFTTHIWALLKQKMKNEYPDIWFLKKNQLDIAKVDKLVDSIPRRLAVVKKARGWYTKY
ncbi:hypothetical protein C7999DRAFT_43765 [Corynascus novoguineensis]|uniref:Transposase n=1 Tax=Corynascus novoguineensis TaxID=1126955 RepID=A0AAN7CNQ5_9PEZI|nr:hypothetical protein C7999DRAFT_43765 [Corynascus novoguineensis]